MGSASAYRPGMVRAPPVRGGGGTDPTPLYGPKGPWRPGAKRGAVCPYGTTPCHKIT